MENTVFDQILEQIANASGSTAADVREQMRAAMAAALNNPEPAVQAMWNAVPKKGVHPTLEEFMDYLIRKNLLQA